VRAAAVATAIASVRGQSFQDWELLVVMQGDDAELRRVVDEEARWDDRIRGLWVAERGLNRARNLAIAAARFDTVAFVDDDCEADSDWLRRIVDAIHAEPDVGLVAGSLVAPPAPRRRISVCPSVAPANFTYRPQASDLELPSGSDYAGANLTVRKWAHLLVGPFDEELGPGTALRGGDDLDFVLRAARAGVTIRFLPDAVVRHSFGRRFGLRAAVALRTGYGIGHGAVAAKMTHVSSPDAERWNGRLWRRHIWRESLISPIRQLRPHRIFTSMPRLIAFERAYRTCLRDYVVNDSDLLVHRT
jgi:glycosyltransferase involved in cell wall biosynthesis